MTINARLDITELEAYRQRLASAGAEIGPATQGVANKYGTLIVQEARRLVPVDTGRLRDSIRIGDAGESGRLGMSGVVIEAGAPYAAFVEFGTRFMAPQPFMRPALQKYRRPYREELIDTAADLLGTKKAARSALGTTRGLTFGRSA